MSKARLVQGCAVIVVLGLIGFVGWIASLPPATAAVPPPVSQMEVETVLQALQPNTRNHPLVAVVGINDATETTDYLVPAGILRRADVAEVLLLATHPGPVQLFPALTVQPDATTPQFDARYPQGADYVLVPAMSRDDDMVVLEWLRAQAKKGATIIGVCAGAKVVAAAGLLGNKRATTHWYYLDDMLERDPTIDYVPDRRLVVDGNMVTTTGITASFPMTLTLIEAIAGRSKAEAVAGELGIKAWDIRHASAAFTLTRPFAGTVLANRMAFWNHEKLGLRLEPGIDEVGLALVADAWSRTYRSNAVTYAQAAVEIVTANGVRIVPDRNVTGWPAERGLPSSLHGKPVDALDAALHDMALRYGERTADVVAMQLEYPRHAESSTPSGTVSLK